LDTALVVAADRVSWEIAQMLDGGVAAKRPKGAFKRDLATVIATKPPQGDLYP
jgi:hypothetical protein